MRSFEHNATNQTKENIIIAINRYVIPYRDNKRLNLRKLSFKITKNLSNNTVLTLLLLLKASSFCNLINLKKHRIVLNLTNNFELKKIIIWKFGHHIKTI